MSNKLVPSAILLLNKFCELNLEESVFMQLTLTGASVVARGKGHVVKEVTFWLVKIVNMSGKVPAD